MILGFANRISQDFKKFTSGGKLHFSAGIELFRKKSPLRHTINLSDIALDEAKSYVDKERDNNKTSIPEKNKLKVFDTVLGWDDFDTQLKLGEKFNDWIKEAGDKREHKHSQFLKRLMHYQSMYEETISKESCLTYNYLYSSYLSYDLQRNYVDKNGENKDMPYEIYKYLTDAIGLSVSNNNLKHLKIALYYAIYTKRQIDKEN